MMILPVSELTTLGVFDANTPNSERVVFLANEDVNLSAFGLLLAVEGRDGLYPLNDYFFWFGPTIVRQNSIVVLFTGTGENKQTTDESGSARHLFYWSKPQTLFADQRIKPLLISIGSMSAGEIIPVSYPQVPLPSLGNFPALPKLSDLFVPKAGMVKRKE